QVSERELHRRAMQREDRVRGEMWRLVVDRAPERRDTARVVGCGREMTGELQRGRCLGQSPRLRQERRALAGITECEGAQRFDLEARVLGGVERTQPRRQ